MAARRTRRATINAERDAISARADIAEARAAALLASLRRVLAVRPREFTKPETQAVYREAVALCEECGG